MEDYSSLDDPRITSFLFHPRPDAGSFRSSDSCIELSIPVDNGVTIGADFYPSDKKGVSILFFHGNGEIVSDYRDLGPLYVQMGINFLPADYRGYGRSSGEPTVSAMMQDCHDIFTFTTDWLKNEGYNGPLIVMGRSLGSASALELASTYGNDIDALIIESGFAFIVPLLNLLGINAGALGITEESGTRNYEKIKAFTKPTLVIHAEYDHIIPYSDGETLYNNSPAKDKRMLKIANANHNNIFMYGIEEYMTVIGELAQKVFTVS